MPASAPLVRRTLLGALCALLVAALLLVGWMGRAETVAVQGGSAAAPREVSGPALAPVLADDEAPPGDPQDPDEAEPTVADTPSEAAERRAAAPPPRPSERSASLRIDWASDYDLVFVGRGGALPLDSPAAEAAARLDAGPAGFVRAYGLSSSGALAVDGIAPGPLRVLLRSRTGRRLELEGLWILPDETLELPEPEPIAHVDCDLRVIAPSGAPLRDARVGLIGDRPGGTWRSLGMQAASPLGLTDRLGVVRFMLPEGIWRLRVEADGHEPFTSEGFIDKGSGPQALEATLQPGRELRAVLLDLDELGLAEREIGGLSVVERGPWPEAALAAGLPFAALARVRTALTDAEGRATFSGLAADDALLLRALLDTDFSHPDAFAPTRLARVGGKPAEVDLRAGASLQLRVVAEGSDSGVVRYSVRLPGAWPLEPRLAGSSNLTWSDLRPFEVTPNPLFADLPESLDLSLEVRAEGFAPLESPLFRLRTGETTELGSLALRALPRVHLAVYAADTGEPLADAHCEFVAVAPEQALGLTHSAARTDERGRALLTVLSNNAADLVVRRRGYAPFRSRAPSANLATTPYEVRLSSGGSLRVRVLDSEREPLRAEVLRRRTVVETGQPLSEQYESALTDAEGWAEFEDLAGGTELVAARALPSSQLDLPPPIERLNWSGAGVPAGAAGEVELAALPVFTQVLRFEFAGEPLPFAVLRFAAGGEAFRDAVADADALLTEPAVRCNGSGLCVLPDLPVGLYSLRVEHPDLTGFGRALLAVDGVQTGTTIDLARDRVRGAVIEDEQTAYSGRAVVWALGPTYYDGLELTPGLSLRELVGERVVFGQQELVNGQFELAVPYGIQLLVTASDGLSSGDYYLDTEQIDALQQPIQVQIELDMTLQVTVDLEAGGPATSELGLVALNRDHPWGRGVIAEPLEGGYLTLGNLPPGNWKLCLVELAGGHLVLAHGEWFEYSLGAPSSSIRLPWRRR